VLQQQLATAARWIEEAQRVLFVTGAGLSADSGLPTYRGVGGLYESEPSDDLPIEVALSGPMFEAQPELTWRHIGTIEAACRHARPNRGHEVIAQLERMAEVVVFTQNVDGFHRAAGSSQVVEIHGAIHRLRCPVCTYRTEVADYAGLADVPTCPKCSAIIRPDVVLFEEMLPLDALARWEAHAAPGFDLVFSVGTSSLFPYVVAPVVEAIRAGVRTIEINPGSTDLSGHVDLHLKEKAAIVLDGLWSLVSRSP
jgi:NAD-dependent deacetylase